MNLWRQTRLFTCPRCRAQYLHDRARDHDLYRCPAVARTREQREGLRNQITEVTVNTRCFYTRKRTQREPEIHGNFGNGN